MYIYVYNRRKLLGQFTLSALSTEPDKNNVSDVSYLYSRGARGSAGGYPYVHRSMIIVTTRRTCKWHSWALHAASSPLDNNVAY